jgi:hypothetical protein
MRTLVQFFLIAASAVLAFAADATGKWKAVYEAPQGQRRESTFDLKADGSTLTGSVIGQSGEAKIQDGKINGEDISFSVMRNFNGQDVKLDYKGKVSADEIKLTVSFGEGRSFDIVAKREK